MREHAKGCDELPDSAEAQAGTVVDATCTRRRDPNRPSPRHQDVNAQSPVLDSRDFEPPHATRPFSSRPALGSARSLISQACRSASETVIS